MATLDQVIGAYRELRARKDEITKKHKEELAPLNDQLNKLLSWVHRHLQEQGTQNTRTQSGSAFLQTDVSVTSNDWDATLAFIKEHELWEFLERRISKATVTEYIESTKTVPPGIKVTSDISCHIRA